ncbi:hypothetical protein [Neptunomonas qingdaonensis]|uniref:PD-(D/E)XK nuclease superfamily protein n=1 Tax=Neptunomonas qingdaonensis TaxID=1045558 RepID=A0A1I2R978_9GAMM|nr:hypothetical protein [Neptunomonas qingdaonensis]SFG37265.1 hypothetical protein SAMN05216175_10614 [Neptunomonas qingdaonensis]
MSKVHYFQRYQQKENVITNNTLLLLSRLYNDNPHRFEAFINTLLSDVEISCDIGPSFTQQQGNSSRSSIPDGAIVQRSMKVLIETKLYDNQYTDQLIRHLDGFANEEIQVLLLINPSTPIDSFDQTIQHAVSEHNKAHQTDVRYCAVTFKEIITVLDDILADHDFTMKEVLDDYRAFCVSEYLLAKHESEMRAVPTGDSFNENFEHGIYFAPASRGFSPHSYIGLYKQKSIRGIGKLLKVVSANYEPQSQHFSSAVCISGSDITDEDKSRIATMIDDTQKQLGWNISQNHNFFIVDKFFSTDFIKSSKGGLIGSKFFDLSNILDKNSMPDCAEIADLLRDKHWGE